MLDAALIILLKAVLALALATFAFAWLAVLVLGVVFGLRVYARVQSPDPLAGSRTSARFAARLMYLQILSPCRSGCVRHCGSRLRRSWLWQFPQYRSRLRGPAHSDGPTVPRKHLTRRCSEPRARLRLTFAVFAIHASAAWDVAPGSRSLILCLVRPLCVPCSLPRLCFFG